MKTIKLSIIMDVDDDVVEELMADSNWDEVREIDEIKDIYEVSVTVIKEKGKT